MKCMLWTVRFPFTVRTHDTCNARTDHSRLPQLSVDRLIQGDFYSKVSFRIGCYTHYRGDRLMQTISRLGISRDRSHVAVMLR